MPLSLRRPKASGGLFAEGQDGRGKTSYELLTSGETEILTGIAEDKKNKEIADILGISVRPGQAHRTNLMDKLGEHDRMELLKYAISKGIVDF